jgi:alginate O-acetyltransferase complex protein AlgI
MLFNSIPYLMFLPIVLAAVWLSPRRFRSALLLVASYLFYMSWIPIYGVLIAVLTAISYFLGLAIDRWRSSAKKLLLAGILINLGALCYYKYADFLLSNVYAAFDVWAGITGGASLLTPMEANIILPLGISFFAFEFIHYLVDVYRGGAPIRGPIDFGLFAAFFPSQLAGPIKRYQDFMAQLSLPRSFSIVQFNDGLGLFLQGLFKKVALADNLGLLVNRAFANTAQLGTSDAWLAAIGFTLQVYFDFSGYTDMGRGSAKMVGFELPDNFNFPYLANSLQQFWKRWHISLYTWLRDYVYIPMGGNGSGQITKYRNLFLTMLIGGLWHGAAWHFVIWGAMHGAGLIVNHWYDEVAKRSRMLTNFHATALGNALSTALTVFFFGFLLVFFRADTTAIALEVVKAMFTFKPSDVLGLDWQKSTVLVALAVYGCYSAVFSLPKFSDKGRTIPLFARAKNWLTSSINAQWQIAVYCGIALVIIGFAPQKPSPFIYFQF